MSSDESEYDENQQDMEVEDGVEDELVEESDDDLVDNDDDGEDGDEFKATAWGKKKNQFYNEEEGKQVNSHLSIE